MADSPVFEHVCEALDRDSDLDRLAARGTVRLALKTAGLDVAGVDVVSMQTVLRRVLPQELEARGIANAAALCDAIAATLADTQFEVATDRATAAASAIARLGS